MMARQRQHVLEILQVRHEGMQIALKRGLAALGQSEKVVPARPRRGLPMFRPGRRLRGKRKSPRPHQDRRRRQLDDTAGTDRGVKGMAGRPEPALAVEKAAARDQRGRLFQ